MQPLQLTLKGFRGVRDGLGRHEIMLDVERLTDGAQLVAIAGLNGSGKSTILDNLTPFVGLPSRAGAAGSGAFSYYDHVYLPESIKDLTWAHEGRCYRSQIVIRLDGRRRTEAFLHTLDDAGRWRPAQIDDGTLSDGRLETYTRCVERICGSAETFFTSVFAAQGKRQLSTYRNAEIKTLLGDLLGQDEIRALGQKAAEVVRSLKTGLATIRQDVAATELEQERVQAVCRELAGAPDRLSATQLSKATAQSALEAAQERNTRVVIERAQSRATDARRSQLLSERQSVVDTHAQALRAIDAQERAERQRLVRLEQRARDRLQLERQRRQALRQSRQRCLAVLAEAAMVRRAERRLPLARQVLTRREARTQACHAQLHHLQKWQEAVGRAEQQLASIERDAGHAVLKAEELARRFGLTAEVPCAGLELQGRCKLLGDAREAHSLIPSAKAQIARLLEEKSVVEVALLAARQSCDALSGAPQDFARAEIGDAMARERVNRLAALCAKAQMCTQARVMLEEVERELDVLGPDPAAGAISQTVDELSEHQQIVAARKAISAHRDRQTAQTESSLARLAQALEALPPAFDEQLAGRSARSLAAARDTLAETEQSVLQAVRETQALEEARKQDAALMVRHEELRARCDRVENALGDWNLFARCMGNDGLIALAIDDAGPALSALANDLLLACYGPRFTVCIHTLLETSRGEQKEGFDIVVHDGDTGASKSVGMMSGGERTLVELCLTRAIALYLARHTGRCYTTLFTDEADGALDPQRKRMFMAMKREVLRLGGYEREFFISQTPELTAMADAVIDLDALRLGAPDGSP